ncbi:MAG: Cache 3/Cache 2 fusion domain-containing protein [Clostridiaceae bacterium]
MNIKQKLICSYLTLIIFTVSILGTVVYQKSRTAVLNEVTEKSKRVTELINTSISVRNDLLIEKVNNDLNFSEKLLSNYGELSVSTTEREFVGNYKIPVMYAGKHKLTLENDLVDDIKQSTSAIATIFLLYDNKLIRISTSMLENKVRKLGSYIDSDSECYKQIVSNKSYFTTIKSEGEQYLTRYKPLVDKNNKVIGAIALGNNIVNNYLEKTINDTRIGKSGYMYVIDSKGDLKIHPNEKGTNAINNDFVKEIISKKNGTIDYTYKGVRKIAYFSYFEPWDWYIITTANYDDLNSSAEDILNLTIISGVIIFIIGSIFSIFMTNTITNPIKKLKECMEIARSGDLSVRSNINSIDEIGILAKSFDNMLSENQRLLDEAVQYDRLKTEFIANISHELRTPINIIFSTIQLFSFYIDSGKILENIENINSYSNTMKQNCFRLLRLVNNIIDITKIDSGFMELNLKNKNIVEVVEEITLSTVEYAKSMDRTVIFDTNVEEKITAIDEEKIERVLLNLISNAIKFTKEGDIIEVVVQVEEQEVIISVKDSGIGIEKDKLSQVFQRFKQVDSSLSRNSEGSGIGLSIVKSLVEMHYGSIEVKSKINEGSEFIIKLPVGFTSNDDKNQNSNLASKSKVEKIHIEFSDIYK